jgi:DNA-binding response OmpR family regulator
VNGHRILVVDDDPLIRRLLRASLEREGFEVVEAASGEEALDRCERNLPDLVLLDVVLPGIDGVEVLRRLRAASPVFVVLVTCRADEVDKLVGLAVGADDYVTKPFSPREVVARVKAVLRRARTGVPDRGPDMQLEVGRLRVDRERHEVTLGGEVVDVGPLEFELLATLATSPGRVFTRSQLLERVWGSDVYSDDRLVDVHIRSLRRLLHDDASAPVLIATVRGVGYKLLPPAAGAA